MTAAAPSNPAPTPAVSDWDRAPMQLPQRERMEILLVVMLGIFLAALDQTIVSTALPTIVSDLSGNDIYVWAFTAYLLTSTVSGPLYGKLSDLFGRRPIFLFGVSVFLIGSLLCGISQSMEQFVVFRGIQGLGAGALFPVSLAIIGDIFAPSERGKYQGFFGAVFGIAFLIGPALGGLITDTVGWHWVFFVNIPLGLVVLFVIWRILPAHRDPNATRNLDYLGAGLLVAALVPILIGFTQKQFGEWTDPEVGGLILLGLVFTVIFVLAEARAKEPILPLHLFRIRAFTASVLAMFLAALGFFAAIVFMPLWFQFVEGSSATESGYQILPLVGGLIVAAVVSGQLVARTGRYKTLTVVSLLTMAGGLYLMTGIRPETEMPTIWLWMFITGLGIGPSFAVFTLVVQNEVPLHDLGTGTSSVTLFQQVGGTVGLAVTGTLFGSVLLDEVPKQLTAVPGMPPEFVGALGGGGALDNLGSVGVDLGAAILAAVPPEFQALVEPLIPGIVNAIYTAFSIATAATFVVGIITSLIAAVLVLVVMPAGKMGEPTQGEALDFAADIPPVAPPVESPPAQA